MTRIVLDATTRSQLLRGLSETLEFCDESGRLLGYFTPVSDSVEQDHGVPPLTEQELLRRLNETEFSTAEVLAHLESL